MKKRLLFYYQPILGIGYLIHSMEIVKGLTPDFHICFINGGEGVQDYPIPDGIEVVNILPLKTDTESSALQSPLGVASVDAAMEIRRDRLLAICDDVQPDVLMVGLFPFGGLMFSPELVPLIERARFYGAQIVCSLRDAVVADQGQERHDVKICTLLNRYFDLLLVHSDPKLMLLEHRFSRTRDLDCPVYYTGYVVPEQQQNPIEEDDYPTIPYPLILVSVGDGHCGHELLHCVAQASKFLDKQIPYHIQMFTGPSSPDGVFERMEAIAAHQNNLSVQCHPPNLLQYMKYAELFISTAGYTTTMNVLSTGVRSLLLPVTGHHHQEQNIRAKRLDELSLISVIHPEDLEPERIAQRVINALDKAPSPMSFDLDGVTHTAEVVKEFCDRPSFNLASL